MTTSNELNTEISEGIISGSLSFFVGAGVSVPSGVPSGPQLSLELVQSWTKSPYTEMLKPYCDNGVLRLEVLTQIARQTVGDTPTVTVPFLSMLDKVPTLNHYVLARALKAGCIVITTNLDVLIELAYFDLYRDLPRVLVTEDEIARTHDRLEGALVKLHGSLLKMAVNEYGKLQSSDSSSTVVVALDRVGRGLGEAKATALGNALRKNHTFFWGYSCMDDFDIFPLLRTQERQPIVWAFFDQDAPVAVLSSSQAWTNRLIDTGPSRRFEAANVSSVLKAGDTCMYGDIAPAVKEWAGVIGIGEGDLGSALTDIIGKLGRPAKPRDISSIELWRVNLLAARLLAQVADWGENTHRLFTTTAESPDLDRDQQAKVWIDYAERITQFSPERAQKILEDAVLERSEVDDDTRAYGFAILSNIYRRRQSKDARLLVDRAVELTERASVREETRHLVRFYEALITHQDIAEMVRELPSGNSLPPDILGKVRQCETTLGEIGTYFQSTGQADNYAMVQNALGLVLLEKGRAYKKARQTDSAETANAEAERVLLEDVAGMRERYGFFRGVGQAFRNVALVRREQGRYEDELDAYQKSAVFYSMVKPTPPETDLYETFFRQAEVYIQLGRREEAILPVLRWILQKKAAGDWHNEARGLKVLADALRDSRPGLDAQYAANWLVAIYQERLSEPKKEEELFSKRYGVPNAKENLLFAKQVAEENGNGPLAGEASSLLDRLKLAEERRHPGF